MFRCSGPRLLGFRRGEDTLLEKQARSASGIYLRCDRSFFGAVRAWSWRDSAAVGVDGFFRHIVMLPEVYDWRQDERTRCSSHVFDNHLSCSSPRFDEHPQPSSLMLLFLSFALELLNESASRQLSQHVPSIQVIADHKRLATRLKEHMRSNSVGGSGAAGRSQSHFSGVLVSGRSATGGETVKTHRGVVGGFRW